MSARNPEVVVDHASDLSSAKESILFLSFLFLQTDLFLELGILDDLVQSRGNLRVQHFKVWESSLPIDCDDLRSSTDSTISTSLIHNVASEGELEQALTWVWDLTFHHENVESVGICQNEAPRFAFLADQPCTSVDTFLLLERESSWLTALE